MEPECCGSGRQTHQYTTASAATTIAAIRKLTIFTIRASGEGDIEG